jgi:hypothetical protein
MNINPFPYSRIWPPIGHPILPHEESIVMVLMGDGFTAAQYGTWPNPAQGTVLWHANRVINTLIETPPFNLFAHLFTVYVIHVPSQPNADGYLNSVDANGVLLPSDFLNQSCVRGLAESVVDPNHQTMIHIISNSTTFNGYALMAWHYELCEVDIAVSSRIRSTVPGIPDGGTLYPNWLMFGIRSLFMSLGIRSES